MAAMSLSDTRLLKLSFAKMVKQHFKIQELCPLWEEKQAIARYNRKTQIISDQ